MNRLRYLNTVLTVLAILLALNLWTQWHATPTPSAATQAHAQGIPDAGQQRMEMVDLLKSLNERADETHELLESGQLTVRVIVADR